MQLELMPITSDTPDATSTDGSELIRGVVAAVIEMYPAGGPARPWIGYLAKEGDTIVGTCAFKSAPVNGEVEIAYFTFPGFEGRGIAFEMARLLQMLAAEAGVAIMAQTLPAHGASTRILEKLGMTMTGSAMHPTDGHVWEWRV